MLDWFAPALIRIFEVTTKQWIIHSRLKNVTEENVKTFSTLAGGFFNL